MAPVKSWSDASHPTIPQTALTETGPGGPGIQDSAGCSRKRAFVLPLLALGKDIARDGCNLSWPSQPAVSAIALSVEW